MIKNYSVKMSVAHFFTYAHTMYITTNIEVISNYYLLSERDEETYQAK
jgi:hypothetical protein